MDNQFKAALQDIVNLSVEDKLNLAFSSIKGLVPEISKHFDDKQAGIVIISIFSTAVAADGKLSKEEYALVKTFLKTCEIEMDDETMVNMIKDLSSKEAYAAVLSLSQMLSSEGQAYLVTLVAAICSIDDRIDPNEVAFLTDLYNA
ncbi:MAG: hypothetical protein IJG87_04625 [Ruminococcus sp.]|nr:hypothetical protein [Ruminococcus sp.]